MDYTNLYQFLESSGVVVPSDSAVLQGMQTKFQEIFGTDLDLSAETPVGRLIEAMAVMVKTTLGVTAQAANQFNIDLATGIYLDSLARIYDLQRIGATKTRIMIKCYFNAEAPIGTEIKAGSLILAPSTGSVFSIDSAIVKSGQVDESGNFVDVGTATALETGPVEAEIGSVSAIQTASMGWIGVTNIAPTYTGTDIETDEAFRKRIKASRPIGVGFNSHLVSALNRMDGVYSNCVLENNTESDIVKLGVPIPPHSVFVGIDCIETEDLYDSIAETIADSKPIGTGMVTDNVMGGTKVSRTIGLGYKNENQQSITFFKAERVGLRVSMSYRLANYTGDNIELDITKSVAESVRRVPVGGIVYASDIANALINSLNISVGALYVQKDGYGQVADTSVQMFGYEVPYMDTSESDRVSMLEIT